MSNPLISAAELLQLVNAPTGNLVLLDVRWVLGRNDNVEQYLAGHLPGAVFVDLERELSGRTGEHTGRHPLPDPADFQAAARRWGIEDDAQVVVYDDAGALAAARCWWLLRHAGFTSVRVLDGGLEAWRQLKGPLELGPVEPTPGQVNLSWGAMPVLEHEQLEGYPGVLIDSRATARYLGIEEPVDPVAGHIPGALNRPTTDNLNSQAHFRSSSELREAFGKLGVPQAGPEQPGAAAYCGSGVTAAHQVLAAELAGLPLALYPGSYSQYVSYSQAPVVTSDEKHRDRR
ncbi:sulfurtransferase [Glutamicibacter endophyticus]